MKQLFKFIMFIFILILLSMVCTACHWELRNPSEMPPQLKILYFDAVNVENHFLVKFKNLLDSMHIQKVDLGLAPFILQVSHYSFNQIPSV